MGNSFIYLCTNILQKDLRIRLPKAIVSNLQLNPGVSPFDIFIDKEHSRIILRVASNEHSLGNEEIDIDSN